MTDDRRETSSEGRPDLPAPPPPPAPPGPEPDQPAPHETPYRADQFVVGERGARRRRSASSLHRGRVLAAVGLVVVLVAGALAFVFTRSGSSGGDVALAMDFHPGDTLTYRMSMAMDASISVGSRSQSFTGAISGPLSMHVVRVNSRRVAAIVMSFRPLSGTVNGRAIPGVRTQHVRIRVAR